MVRIELAGLVAGLLLVAACGPGEADGARGSSVGVSAPQARGTREHPWRIGLSQCNLGEPWRVQMDADVRAAAAAHDNLVVVFKDAQNDALKQRTQLEEFVDQGMDLVIISPKEAAPLTRPVRDAVRQGVPVIVLDRDLQGQDYTCFIGGDNVRIGREAGRWIRQALAGTGKIVELKGLMTSTPGQDRHSGFLAGLELDRNPGLQVVFEGEMQWLEPNARREMESALATHPQIDVVYAHNDPGAHGAWLAARAAGREEQMLFVGIDALPHEGVAYVKQGILDATLAYPTGGAEAIDIALKILAGEPVPKRITLGTRLYTAQNVEQGGQALE